MYTLLEKAITHTWVTKSKVTLHHSPSSSFVPNHKSLYLVLRISLIFEEIRPLPFRPFPSPSSPEILSFKLKRLSISAFSLSLNMLLLTLCFPYSLLFLLGLFWPTSLSNFFHFLLSSFPSSNNFPISSFFTSSKTANRYPPATSLPF